ncbi:MAG: hypothetical protein QME75_13845 [Deltaproteobacteria bacterium]|nr:hypothetical protein [Deltaproteobacteria bacterium]
MFKERVRGWWRRLLNNLPWRQPRLPVWGEGSPKVLGVCRRCGAMVMEGWHAEAEDGCLCRRCAHSLADKE